MAKRRIIENECIDAARSLLAELDRFADSPSDRISDERWHHEVLPAIRKARAAISKAEALQ